MDNNILINIPHSSIYVPEIFLKKVLINQEKLRKEINILTDSYTNELFYNEACENLVCTFSRIFCDVERFRDDNIEVMSKLGMGAIYEKTTMGEELINVNTEYKNWVLSNYYDVHHNKLNKITENIIKKHGNCIIIDAHSFSEKWVNIFNNSINEDYPDICIGYDKDFCDNNLIELLKEIILKNNYTYCENYPFTGSIVPSKYYIEKDKRVFSIMIEINRKLYIDEETGLKNKNFEVLKSMIRDYISTLQQMK